MTSFATPLPTTTRPIRSVLSRTALWNRLVHRLAAAAPHDHSLRAGTERPAPPMHVSISLGGPAHLR